MNIQFLYENGEGSVVDEYGRPEPMDYIVDEEQFRLETLSSHTQYLAQRPLESEKIVEAMQVEKEAKPSSDTVRRETSMKRTYTRYSDQDKVRFFKALFEKCLSAAVAAKRLGIHIRTAQKWAEHIAACPSKKPGFNPLIETARKKIQERLDWIRKWEKTDMDFTTNCVFLDESAFHINLKRSIAWSKKVSPAVVTVPKTRAKTTTILGAISAQGLIKCSLRLPQPPPNKKRKRGEGVGYVSKGTVTGHYISFLKATMDEMDRYPHMKGHYLVMDNAPIHTLVDIAKYVESRGHRCVYLPPYSPELNPIEQFWSVVKSKVKRNKLLETEILMTRISEAPNSLRLRDFKGFVWHSHKCLDKCRNREQL
ncbi:hypothetical protein G6F57_014867 [Rhizopus arrhizus]|nr:hypothetical protein G6F27_012814 [Rhizopus arrhizus]KAG1017972.1 hypothetical protein G6F26_011312 [Rhizopus arrhizus]KAG1333514.1 hypothetical protein G6F63_010247 [Rhizopus arrhizus]KAG1414084.1 hypothetical protein G6F59_010425 [Rhizopus arrhizus]KAG1457594.1 hypothetical protein G6F57_014867 [Rhizopus arrhizus]